MHRTNNLNDYYSGSGTRLKRSKKKHGKHNHKLEIIEFYPTFEILCQKEIELIAQYKNDPLCMNITNGGEGFTKNHTEKSKAKISEKLKGKLYEEIHGQNIANDERLKRAIGVRKDWQNMTQQKREERMHNVKKSMLKIVRKDIPQQQIICPKCGLEGGLSSMKRWHFDNCKPRPYSKATY